MGSNTSTCKKQDYSTYNTNSLEPWNTDVLLPAPRKGRRKNTSGMQERAARNITRRWRSISHLLKIYGNIAGIRRSKWVSMRHKVYQVHFSYSGKLRKTARKCNTQYDRSSNTEILCPFKQTCLSSGIWKDENSPGRKWHGGLVDRSRRTRPRGNGWFGQESYDKFERTRAFAYMPDFFEHPAIISHNFYHQ